MATVAGFVASLLLGRLYDRFGLPVILGAECLSALFSQFIFLGNFYLAFGGLLLWGVGYAVQNTLLKARVAGMLPEGRRNFAFGLFYSGYGVGWLAGSVATGLLYQYSVAAVITFAVAIQLLAIPVFILAHRTSGHRAAA